MLMCAVHIKINKNTIREVWRAVKFILWSIELSKEQVLQGLRYSICARWGVLLTFNTHYSVSQMTKCYTAVLPPPHFHSCEFKKCWHIPTEYELNSFALKHKTILQHHCHKEHICGEIYLSFFFDRVSLCSACCSRADSVDQPGPKLTEIYLGMHAKCWN